MSDDLAARCRVLRAAVELDVEISLPTGRALAVLGRSGAGKSTLLRALAGLDESSGFVRFGTEAWHDTARGTLVPTHRRGLGYLFQEDALLPHLTVRGNLELARRFARPPTPPLEISHLAELCGIEPWLERRPSALSGGQRRRVALARALAGAPRLLLLDEPFTGLDAAARKQLSEVLSNLRRELGFTELHATHSLEDALRGADQLLVLERGRVLDVGSPESVLNRGALLDLFPDHRGYVWMHEGTRHFVREDQLLVTPVEPGASSAAWVEHVELLELRAGADDTLELHCAAGERELVLRQPRERVAAWSLEVGHRLWLSVLGSVALGPGAPHSQPMRDEPSARSST